VSDVGEPSDLSRLGDAAIASEDDGSKLSPQPKKTRGERRNVFARIALFWRQVVAELRKVIWPTRRDLIQYTWVVVIFCVIMSAFIAACDFVFGKGVLKVFGG